MRIQTDDPSFVRDLNSHALLANDKAALMAHRAKRKQEIQNAHQINQLTQDVIEIKKSIEQLNKLLLEKINVSERSIN